MREEVKARLDAIPATPGVYVFKDDEGTVIYVGKAISLRDRVRSYFREPSDGDLKGKALRAQISGMETTVCESEVEALVLENTLIKKHQPRFNFLLKDDKSYPYIGVTVAEEFPRVILFRGKREQGVRYYGPFVEAGDVKRTIRMLERVFPLRHCRGKEPGKSGSVPCIYRDMGSCLGPCTGEVDSSEYRSYVQMLTDFLEGRHREVMRNLEARMIEASQAQEYERAARFRDQIKSAENVLAHQRFLAPSSGDYDVIGVHTDRQQACFSVARNRDGFHVGNLCFFAEVQGVTESSELICEFVKRYYGQADSLPDQVLVPAIPEDQETLGDWLSSRRSKKVVIRVPLKGRKLREMSVAEANARVALEGANIARARDKGCIEQALSEIHQRLGLSRFPLRIECYDVSTMGGTASVGSMVLFVEGVPMRRFYRRYRIKFTPGVDDVGMMKEILYRRLRRCLENNSKEGGVREEAPDLILLDGGAGQLGAGLEVMELLGIKDIDVAALAKRFEEVYRPGPGKPITIPRQSEALFLLQRIRDEAHRVAVTYHRSLMRKHTADSWLDQVAGVGPARKKAMVMNFGSPGKVGEASVEELRAVGMPVSVAEAVYQAYRASKAQGGLNGG